VKLLKKDMEDHLESCEHRMMECELCEGRMKVMEAEVSVSFSLSVFFDVSGADLPLSRFSRTL